jgi:hypothetical protein
MPLLLGTLASSVQKVSGAFESIATATGTGSSGTITFSSIPGTYQHLQLRINSKNTTGNNLELQFNSDTGANYVRHYLRGNGSTVTASAQTAQNQIEFMGSGGGTPNPAVLIIDIQDYASTSKNKTVRNFSGQDENGSGIVILSSGLWLNTNAVTSITFKVSSGNFTTDSTFALYGIKG